MNKKSQDTTMENETSRKTNPRNKRKRLIRLLILVLLIAGISIAVPWYRHASTHESTDDAFIDGRITAVSPRISGHVIHVYVNDNQWVEKGDLLVELDPSDYEVRLASARAVMKSARVTDEMRAQDVDLTQIASLSGMDDANGALAAAQSQVDAARAEVAAAAAQVREIEAQVKIARTGLDLARTEETSAQVEYGRNQADLERYRQMIKTQMISRQQLDHMEATVKMSDANLLAARQRVKTKEMTISQYEAALATAGEHHTRARAQLKTSQAQLAQARAKVLAAQAGPKQVRRSRSMIELAKADLEKAQAAVSEAGLNLSYTKIHAQTSGYVSNKSVETGMFVQTGQPLMALVSKDLWVIANFKETQLSKMRSGQPVEIRVDTYPGAVFKGRVDSLQHGTGSCFSLLPAQNATGNFVKVVQRVPVKILFSPGQNHDGLILVPGMSVVPDVDISVTPEAGEKLASNTAVR